MVSDEKDPLMIDELRKTAEGMGLRIEAPEPGVVSLKTKPPRQVLKNKAPCEHPGCDNRMGVRPSPAFGGALRCAWHDPDRRQAAREKGRKTHQASKHGGREIIELPVQAIETLLDAEKVARWIPVAIAQGILSARDGMAMIGAIKEFRMTHADRKSLDRIRALEEQLANLKRGG